MFSVNYTGSPPNPSPRALTGYFESCGSTISFMELLEDKRTSWRESFKKSSRIHNATRVNDENSLPYQSSRGDYWRVPGATSLRYSMLIIMMIRQDEQDNNHKL
jgi:hypothetical protein